MRELKRGIKFSPLIQCNHLGMLTPAMFNDLRTLGFRFRVPDLNDFQFGVMPDPADIFLYFL